MIKYLFGITMRLIICSSWRDPVKVSVKSILFLICASLLFPSFARAEIIDIASILEVDEHIQNDSLVIFDLDNTIFEPTQELGSAQWFQQRVHDYRNAGLDKEVAKEKALVEWAGIQGVTEMRLVESHSLPLISRLQHQGYTLMGLSTRGFEVSAQTLNHLDALGVFLKSAFPYKNEHVFMNEDKGVLYKNGILFTSGTHKGSALFTFLEHAKFLPSHIVFINDKGDQLQEVAQVCSDKKVSFVGLRYGYLDGKVEAYNHSVAIKQFEHFGKILSDDHAKNLLKRKSYSNF